MSKPDRDLAKTIIRDPAKRKMFIVEFRRGYNEREADIEEEAKRGNVETHVRDGFGECHQHFVEIREWEGDKSIKQIGEIIGNFFALLEVGVTKCPAMKEKTQMARRTDIALDRLRHIANDMIEERGEEGKVLTHVCNQIKRMFRRLKPHLSEDQQYVFRETEESAAKYST